MSSPNRAPLLSRVIALEVRARAVLRQPALRAELLDDHRERLAELAVVLDVKLLVRELVKQQARDVLLATVDHRAQHGIVEITERRVGGGAAAVRVEAFSSETIREAVRGRFVEVTAVRDAAGEWKTPELWVDRKLLRRHDVPDDERPVECYVARIAVIAREIELVDGELTHRSDSNQRALQRGSGCRIRDNLVDRLSFTQQLELAIDRLPVIRSSAASARRRERAYRNRFDEPIHGDDLSMRNATV